MNKKLIILISVLTLIILAFAFSFVKNERIERDLELFSNFYRSLNEHYVDSIHSDKLIKKVIDATTKFLDPYTVFYDAEQTKEREKAWAGIQYAGIGATIQQFDSLVYITDLLDNYPAQLVGLKIGDAFLKINDTIVSGKDLSFVRSKLIGIKDTPLTIEIKRGNEILKFNLIRKEVISPAVDLAFMYDKSIAYIRLNHFLKNSSKQFKQKLDSLVSQNKIEKLIIDLRQNTGGMVDECITTLGYFLPANTQVCYLKGFNKESNYSYFTSNVDGDTTLPISILISNKTISAGEIFAGALQDLDRAELIGERTFGKGYVQGTRYPGMGTSLYVTAARYFTPSGRCIQERKYAFDVTTSNFTDTINIFYTKKGKIVKANGGVEPDINFKNEIELNLNQIFTEKEMFFYLNSLYEKYTNAIDTLNFLEAESKKMIKYLSKNLNLIKHPADDELKLLEERISNKLDASIYKNEIRIIQQKINKKKIELLKKYEKQIKFELQAQFIKRKYSKAQEELFRIQNDLILKQVKN
jgi:carboxyl-terminal processing protease